MAIGMNGKARLVVERIDILDRSLIVEKTRNFTSIVSEISETPGQSVFFCNVHMLMLSQEDRVLADAMDLADWVFADGVPVAWLQRRISQEEAQVIRGYEVMLAVCERAAKLGEKVGLFGSTDEVMKSLIENLSERFEGLDIAFQYCPPYSEGELTTTREESVLDARLPDSSNS